MLNTNNAINTKKEERKYSWSTLFAWLYLKTIGRILPKKWSRWAENILYYDKVTANNDVQTDGLKTVDESAQVIESQSEVKGAQTDRVAFQDAIMQTKYIEKADKSTEVDLRAEVVEKESEDEGIYSGSNNVSISEDCSDIENEDELTWDNNYEMHKEDDEKLKDISQEIRIITRLCNDQAHLIADLQTGNDLLEEENRELKSKLVELEKSYRKLAEVVDKLGEEFLAKLKERSDTIVHLGGELIKLSVEFANETRKLLVELEEKDTKINILTTLNEALEQDIKKIETKNSEQQQIAEIYIKLNELLSNIIEISERTLQLHNQEQQEEKKSLENKVLELQKQVQTLEGNKEWELTGIDGTLKKTFLIIIELLEQQLLPNNQEQSIKEKKLEELTLSYDDREHQIEELHFENDLTAEKKAGSDEKHTESLYDAKFVQSYTDSLPKNDLEELIKTEVKRLDSSNVQELAKNISKEFALPEDGTPSSSMRCITSSTAKQLKQALSIE